MLAAVTKALESFSESGLALIILVVIIWMVYTGAKFLGKWEEKEKSMKFLREEFIKTIYPMKATLDALSTKVDNIFNAVHPQSPFKTNSPISLTSVGENMRDAMGVVEVLDEHQATLEKSEQFQKLDNAYDLQLACFAILEELKEFLSDGQLKAVKDEAFRHGILFENAMGVYAIVLRDRLLEKNGWSQSDVDRHDPDKGISR